MAILKYPDPVTGEWIPLSSQGSVYVHTYTGTVHNFQGAGVLGIVYLTEDFTAGDTFTVNGAAVTLSNMKNIETTFVSGRWSMFLFTGTLLTFLQREEGQGVPTGGAIGQALIKSGTQDFVTEWAAVGRTNPNLLINSNFTDPVNTYGRVSGSAVAYADTPIFPCWRVNGTATWNQGGGLLLAPSTYLYQFREIHYSKLLGKKVTLSAKLSDGTYTSVTLTLPASVNGSDTYTSAPLPNVGGALDGFNYRAGGATMFGRLQYYVPLFQVYTGASAVTVSELYCELGEVSTHPYAVPIGYDIDIMRCKRYLYSTMQTMYGTIEAGIAYVNIKFEHEMRIPPSLISYPSTAWLIAGGSSGTQSLPSSPLHTITKESATVKINASGFPGFNVVSASPAVAPFVFDARL